MDRSTDKNILEHNDKESAGSKGYPYTFQLIERDKVENH